MGDRRGVRAPSSLEGPLATRLGGGAIQESLLAWAIISCGPTLRESGARLPASSVACLAERPQLDPSVDEASGQEYCGSSTCT